MRRTRLICRVAVLLACCGVLAEPIAAASAAVRPTVSSLRAQGGAVTVRVSTPATVRLSIYAPVPAGCRKPYCAAELRGQYLVVAVVVGKHGYVSQPRYAVVTV
jgi:hypothetical protein